MELNFDLLKRICEAPGIPGREDQVRQIVLEEMRPLVDEVYVDPLGSVVGTKKGSGGPRVMLAAHMDEIGCLVRHVDDSGALRLQPLGGLQAANMLAQRVRVHTRDGEALLGAIQAPQRPRNQPPGEAKPYTIDELFVDLGLSAEEVRAAVEVGDMVTMDRSCERAGHTVMSKALDDRVSVYIMLEILRAVGAHQADIVAVATVQEEVGLRGAGPAAFGVTPDVGVALDVTGGDPLGSEPARQVARLGAGAGIKVFDGSVIPNHKLVRHFREVAERHDIPYQLEILPAGGTDAGAIERSRAGVPSITISTPTRYVHTVNEMAHVDDIQAVISLVARYLEEAQNGDYRLG
ncbi:MAG TPA: M42 family metallopeptidase [Thermomicrobiaceae bacterium]|nr:M42 family metallopeptidase [Thermomicrobiaceae bacterium]